MLRGVECDEQVVEVASVTDTRTLDPDDWIGLRMQAHRMMDDMLDYMQHIRERTVWQPIPDEVRAWFHASVPSQSTDLDEVHREFMQQVLPFAGGNVHPGFMGWVQGGGTPVGMLAEMLAAGLNANLGGRDHIPIEVERQIVRWMSEIFGFPETASGLFVTGASMANLMATVVARYAALGFEVRRHGVAQHAKPLTAYAAKTVHSCVARAMDITGVGSDALRLIETDSRHRIDLNALEQAIERDRCTGLAPFMVIGTAGTTDTGATDDLDGLAELCQRQKLWLHIDGAGGALAMLAPELAPRLKGIERADSLALDFHKWGQVPYSSGFLLVRDEVLHRDAFASSAAYLQREHRGMAAGARWPCDYGPDLSRGFSALKAWFTLKVYGTEALGAVIAQTCHLARYLKSRIEQTSELELLAPVELNIVCFRYRAQTGAERETEELNCINRDIVIELQESGSVAPSSTTIDGRFCIRAAIVNHRTSRTEIDALIEQTIALGRALDSNCSAESNHIRSYART
jgi:aromatic-L-amino-acid/L-tryptophan decarboxylase